MAKNNKYQDWSKTDLLKEIDRLNKRKKYGLVWEDKPEDVVEQCKKKLPVLEEDSSRVIETSKDDPVNLLIEGDNYHALSVLNYTHKKKIDVIYIDPPYNTGAKDWKYNNNYVDDNDTYRHSKWLSMMNNRLILAKKLLKDDGILICTIDENELANLGVLLDEIFPRREIHPIVIVHNPRGIQGKNFSYTHEYAYFVIPKNIKAIANRIIPKEERKANNLRKWGGESLRSDAKNCFYPIYMSNAGKFVKAGKVPDDTFHPGHTYKKLDDGLIEIWPIDTSGVERKWRYSRQSINKIKEMLILKKIGKRFEIQIEKPTEKQKTVWIDPRYDAGTYGTRLINKLIEADFPYPKSMWNTKDCIFAALNNKKKGVVLDFFAGSGTTGHAVLKLNEEDGGTRQFILCTNNENKIAEEVCYPRVKKVIKGYQHKGKQKKGLGGNLKYFKTTFVDANQTDKNKHQLTQKATDMLCIKEATYELVKSTKDFKIFTNGKKSKYTGIVYDQLAIPGFKDEISKIEGPFSVYIFSLADDTFEEEFADISNKVTLSPIPESILRVYRRIFK